MTNRTVSRRLEGARILITGGTGSFGNKVAARLLSESPAEIRIYSRDEKKQWEMQRAYPQLTYIIGDVRDHSRMDEAMHGVDFVFHAAALKQVPSCEDYPMEAVKTNIVGSQIACACARANGVQTFVALSTDKAVKPVNAMGISKAMMEKIVCSQNRTNQETTFCCVRYGNVMGSRGSVIPLFEEQAKRGLPLTITVPEMTRFLLTLEDSVGLVLHAMRNAQGGEIFIRKAPACTVQSLADAIRRRDSTLGLQHPIHYAGIRPGEKIHEVLVNEYEMQRAVETEDHYVIQPEYRSLIDKPEVEAGEEYTSANTEQLSDLDSIDALLNRMGRTEYYL